MERSGAEQETLLLDEIALAGAEHLDPEYVASYDRKTGSDPCFEIHEVELLREVGLEREGTLVDLGAGTGTLAIAAAQHCAGVIAVDVSPVMLAAIERKAEKQGISNVKCVQAGFLSYDHRGDAVDLVYSRNALHHLPDYWKALALRRIGAFLRPGGVLRLRDIVFAFGVDEVDVRISAWLDSAASSPEQGWTRSELETHLLEEHSTFNWLLEPMIERAGFKIERANYGSRRIFAEYVCRKAS